MQHRGTRSEYSLQKRAARQYILAHSFRDTILAETVCIVTNRMVITELQKTYDAINMDAVNVEKGEVVLDSRGQGSMQRVGRR